MEPTASLWDCAEFIATSYKLEVDTPGAPLFMMISRFFTLLLPPGAEYAAVMVNTMVVAGQRLHHPLFFWSITHLGRRITANRGRTHRSAHGPFWAPASSVRWPTPSPTPSGSRPSKGEVYAFLVLYGRSYGPFSNGRRCCRRAPRQPLAPCSSSPHGALHRCTPAQPARHSGHRLHLLFLQDDEGDRTGRGQATHDSGRHPVFSSTTSSFPIP